MGAGRPAARPLRLRLHPVERPLPGHRAALGARVREIDADVEDAARGSRWASAARCGASRCRSRWRAIGAAALLTFVFARVGLRRHRLLQLRGPGRGDLPGRRDQGVRRVRAPARSGGGDGDAVVPLVLVGLAGPAAAGAAREPPREGDRSAARTRSRGRSGSGAGSRSPTPSWSRLLGITIGVPAFQIGKLALRAARPAAGRADQSRNAQLARGTVDVSVYAAEDPVKVALRRHIPDLVNSFKHRGGRDAAPAAAAAFGPARALARAALAVRAASASSCCARVPRPDGRHGDRAALRERARPRLSRHGVIVSLALASRYLPLAVLTLRASWVTHRAGDRGGGGARRCAARAPLPAHHPPAAPARRARGRRALASRCSLREFDSIVLLFGAQEMLTTRIYNLRPLGAGRGGGGALPAADGGDLRGVGDGAIADR